MNPNDTGEIDVARIIPRGRAMFEWAIAFAALALVFPVSSVIGIALALEARRRGYARWPAALVMAVWCGALGAVLRGMLGIGMVP